MADWDVVHVVPENHLRLSVRFGDGPGDIELVPDAMHDDIKAHGACRFA